MCQSLRPGVIGGPSERRSNDGQMILEALSAAPEAGLTCWFASPLRTAPVACERGRDLYVSVLVVYEVNICWRGWI
jgi:hypothetical protein